MKLFRTSIEQTGVAIFVNKEGEEKAVPLFSDEPCEEARDLRKFITGYTLSDVFYANVKGLIDYRIEDLIKDFYNKHGFLPENYVEELVCGFPYIGGMNKNFCFCYK